MGFFLLDPDAGTVVDQFPHLYPTAIAIGYGVDGPDGRTRRGIDRAPSLGVLALYFLGARLAGPAAGAAAAGLLAINVIEVWYARYPELRDADAGARADGVARAWRARTWTTTRSSRRWQASSWACCRSRGSTRC